MLCAIAVMHIPIHNSYPFCLASLACGLYRNSDIIQKTKTIRIVWQAMMAGRAGQRIGIFMLAIQNRK